MALIQLWTTRTCFSSCISTCTWYTSVYFKTSEKKTPRPIYWSWQDFWHSKLNYFSTKQISTQAMWNCLCVSLYRVNNDSQKKRNLLQSVMLFLHMWIGISMAIDNDNNNRPHILGSTIASYFCVSLYRVNNDSQKKRNLLQSVMRFLHMWIGISNNW